MPQRFIIRNPADTGWLMFADPVDVLQAKDCKGVLDVMAETERRVDEEKLHAAGFVTYEAAGGFDPAYTTNPAKSLPLVCFGLFSEVRRCDALPDHRVEPALPPLWRMTGSRQDYIANLSRIKHQIELGNTYQINYTVRQEVAGITDPWELFLRTAADAPFAAYMEYESHAIVSASPELFFRLSKQRLISKPMKGTAPRGMTTNDDRVLREQLYDSQKNRAENVMITDMVRNDMGRIAEPGSVTVPALYEIEKYPTVWQMTSTVSAETKAPVSRIFQALFPSASVTGAPKVSSMELIADLEDTPREIYTGAIGFISPEREAQFSVAIRTALVDRTNHRAVYGVGGGIVWDSDPGEEYLECLAKAKILSMPPVSRNFQLLETMLWNPTEGYFLLDEHLNRMRSSAEYFDFDFDEKTIRGELRNLEGRLPAQRCRVRLLLQRNGQIQTTETPLGSAIDSLEQKVALAKQPVRSDTPFVYHKTTRREIYESALEDAGDADDVLLWNDDGYITETSIANVIVCFDGERFTPPVECGLLAGTYRAWLLEKGEVRERKIHIDELSPGSELTLINSVRGEYPARLHGVFVAPAVTRHRFPSARSPSPHFRRQDY